MWKKKNKDIKKSVMVSKNAGSSVLPQKLSMAGCTHAHKHI